MGVYYQWINATKRQTFENVFWNGHKLFESCGYDIEETNALLTLLATDWYGDFVAFVPDEGRCCHIAPDEEGRLGILRDLTSDYPEDYAIEWFDNITGIFRCAKDKSGWFCIPKGPDGVHDEMPYEGPFDRDVVVYRYIVNETTREWYDRERSEEEFGGDPIPLLLGLCDDYLRIDGEFADRGGQWMGDVIRPSHEPPEGDYRDITGYYSVL